MEKQPATRKSFEAAVLSSAYDLRSKITEEYITSEEFFARYQSLDNLLKLIKEAKDGIVSVVTDIMEERLNRALENGLTDGNVSVEGGKVTLIPAKSELKRTFDEETFKAENPELYAKYVKETVKDTKSSLRITPSKKISKEIIK